MGMDINAMIIVGRDYSEIPEDRLESVNDLLDEDTMQSASPYYDAPREHWTVGFQAWGQGDFEWDQDRIDTLKAKFKAHTGLDAVVSVLPNVW
jgi:hypothetical protein